MPLSSSMPVEAAVAAAAGDAIDARQYSQTLLTLVQRYQSPLLNYAAQLLPDHPDQAHDVVQTTFLKLRAALVANTALHNPGAWLYRVAHNLAVDINRQANRHCQLDEAALASNPGDDPGPAVNFGRQEARDLALAELRRLPEPERQVLLLKMFEDLTLREIATITETGISTVHYRLQTGLGKLAQRLKKLGVIAS